MLLSIVGVPNTNHTDDPITHELAVRTTKPLKKGEIIKLSYAYTLQVSNIFCFLCVKARYEPRTILYSTGNVEKTTALERGKVFLVHLRALHEQWWIVDSCIHADLSQMWARLHRLVKSPWRRCSVEVNFVRNRFFWLLSANLKAYSCYGV